MSSEAVPVDLPLRIGARTLFKLRRRLVRKATPLAEALAPPSTRLPLLPPDAHGYLLFGVPEASGARLTAGTGLRPFVRQRYARRYASLEGGFESYLARFSARTRATLKRKLRKFAEENGGLVDVRAYHQAFEVGEFCAHAHAVSALTYQERLLDAGLPPDIADEMALLSETDSVRAWLLFLGGKPVSYLYAPADGETLLYAYLGYDPSYSHLSPGSVLQLEAMRLLMEEGRFRWFDFAEGDGQHKRQFATDAIESVDLLLLRPTLLNVLTAHILAGFDGAVSFIKGSLQLLGLAGLSRALRR